ncbi:MAG: arylsulfatase [Bacteroidales bacterium]|jgi:arylsulfatase A-like enzyme|nr:arylsulfatase [Bacteroidales bacterium]
MRRTTAIVLTPLLVFSSCRSGQKQEKASVPNIVYILADDLGYGDLSCYGQSRFKTPNIDRLAAEGKRFTQHYAGTTVSAPSRCSLMTGLHTGHTFIRGNRGWKPEGQFPIPASTYTIAEALKTAGYATGAFGKWGLGYIDTEGSPNKQGFDEFYGYNCQSLAHNYYPDHLWDNETKVLLGDNSGDKFAIYAPELIHQRALQFIEKNRERPFFLYYPSIIPHAELLPPQEYIEPFRGLFLPEKEFKGAEPGDENFRRGPYGTQRESHAAFAAMVSILDKQVGEILDKLTELGLDENTLVIFTSDNGPHLEGGADPDYFDSNGPLRGYKRDLYEGGIREPMIARWSGKIKAGTTTDHISAFWDVFPTLTELADIDAPENLDGISFVPTLFGNDSKQPQHEYLYWEFHERGGRKAIRQGNWKLVQYNVANPEETTVELYNLSTDIGEENNVAAQNSETVQELLGKLQSARTESELFTFNGNPVTGR